MNPKNQKSFFYFLALLFLAGCGGMVCEGEKTVVFDYDPILKTVDVGGAPTYFKGKNAPWVKKIIVKPKGFIVVTEVKTAGYKKLPCDDDKNKLCEKHVISSYHNMQIYTEKEGYKYWFKIPEKEWTSISGLEDRPSIKPDMHVTNCRFAFFGRLLTFIIAALRV